MKTRTLVSFGLSAVALGGALAAGTAGYSKVADAARQEAANAKRAAEEAGKAQRALVKHNAREAIRRAEAAVELDPRNSEYRALLGQSYLLAGRFVSASQALTDAMKLDPADGKAALNLALAKIGSGDWGGARAVLDQHAAQIPGGDLGLAVALTGDPAKGVEILGEAARQPEADAKTRQNLALTLALAGRWPEAKAVASVDLPPDQVDKRLMDWAKFVQPRNAYDQVAWLLGVQAVEDAGQPVRLALRETTQQLAGIAQTVDPVDAYMPGVPAGADQVESAPVAQVAASEPAPVIAPEPAPESPVVPALASATTVGAGIVYGPRQEIVQAIPAERVALAARVRSAQPVRPVAAAARALSQGNYFVQIGAYANARVARDAWARAVRRTPALAEQKPFGANISTRAGTFYRLSVGGFSRGDAASLCSAVKAHGGSCFVRASAGDQVASWGRGVQLASR